MDYMENIFSLVLFGGRVSVKTPEMEFATPNYYFNDLWLFNIAYKQWCKVNIHGSLPEERYSHLMAVHESTLIIFGGLNDNGP